MKTILELIPKQYLAEFVKKYAMFIKNRVDLYCVLALTLYLSISAISILLYPEEFRSQELWATVFLVVGAAVILLINRKTATLGRAKLMAYLFAFFVLAVITKLNMIYYDYFEMSSALYVFILLFVSFTIPWLPYETIFIAAMHIMAYTILYLYLDESVLNTKNPVTFQSYFEGLIFILAAFVLAITLRKKETYRDIENFVLLKEVETKNDEIRHELELARQIHKTLVPKSMNTDLVDIAVLYHPASYLGGDYARFHFIDKDRLIFIICDVTGHGVSAALLVNRLHAEFERLAKEGREPGLLLKELNDFINEDFEGTNMYLSAFCGLLNFKNRVFYYSNHGHPTQYLYRLKDNKIVGFYSQTALLGLPMKDKNIYQHEVEFEKGDRVLLFTDGVTETMDSKHEEYGIERLEKFILANSTVEPTRFNHQLLEALSAFKSREFQDDIFILTMAIK